MDAVYSYDWYDGPRSGVADYNGQPHFFQSQWADIEGLNKDWFKLSPISKTAFEQELERWSLWKRYEAAYKVGAVAPEHHPFLPIDRKRGIELMRELQGYLKINDTNCIIAQSQFMPVNRQMIQLAVVEMIVEWQIILEPPYKIRKVNCDF